MGVVEFRKDLGLGTAITIIIGSMIGSGILLLPGVMGAAIGNSGLLLLAWIVPGFLTIVGALTFAEMAAAYPRAGGQYVFLREGLGQGWSFLFGWTMFWLIMSGIIAGVAVAFATFVDFLFPLPGTPLNLGFVTVPKWGTAFVAAGSILFLAGVNYVGVKYGGFVQNLSTAAKVLGIGALTVGAFLFSQPSHDIFADVATSAPTGTALLAAFGGAVVLSLFAYDGWPQATYVAAEVKDAKRNLPKALLIGPLITTVIYVTTVAAYTWALPIDQIVATGASGGRIATSAAQVAFGVDGARIIAIVAMISTFGTVNAYVLTAPRVFYAMAKDGAFLKGMGKLDPKRATPAFALLMVAEWASLLVLTGTYAQLVTIVVFSLWLFYIPTVVAYFRLHKDPKVEKPFLTPGYPWVPLLFLASAIFVVVATLIQFPREAFLSLAFIALGVPVYYWQARRTPRLDWRWGREPVTEQVADEASPTRSR
jgi:basic amino acid/polyamine antiporter, APA family